MILMISVHTMACLFYFTASFHNFDKNTWISRLELTGESSTTLKFQQYLAAFYWAFQTVTTVG
jgi:hypothetical protein